MKRNSYNAIFNIPNILTVLRIIFIIPFVFAVSKNNYVLAGAVLVISGISDLFDGIIARKYNQITKLGKMLDPTADKLTLMAVMICFGIKFPKIFPFMILLIVKEILMLTAGAVLLKHKSTPPSARWYGKISTVVFYVSVITIILLKALWNTDCEVLNIILMTLTATCMLYALYRYFKIFKMMIKEEKY